MLRLLTPFFIVAAAIAAAPAGATSAYSAAAVRDAAACARACADDGICMAWTFRTGGVCELSAVAPSAPPFTDAAAFGLSTRAPAFAQVRALTPVAAPAPAPVAPPPAVMEEAPPQVALAQHEEPAEDDLVLLGGPDDESLRLQFSRPR